MSTTAPDPAAELHLPQSIDLAAFTGLSAGQLAGIAEHALTMMATKLPDPFATDTYARYTPDPAADWSGHQATVLDNMHDDATNPESG